MGPRPGQKTVLVTGCTPGGIGHALAVEFHAQGLHVIATARRPDVLREMGQMGMSTLQLDVTKADSIAKCKAEVSALTGGKLDILVNNAGCTHTHPATDIDLDDVRATFETNVFAVMAMCQAFVPLLMEARGLIVNIASLAAISPYVFGSVYCASKGAIVSYSRCLRLELRPLGVRVTVAMTGTVRSNTATQRRRPLPDDSLYARVRDLFEMRLVWSQQNSPMDTAAYASKLVAAALRPEAPLPLRAWLGRPDWLWAGGMSRLVWFGTWVGEWLIDAISWRKFGLARLEEMVKAEAEQKKLR